jgi:hypothetical protein
MPVYKITCPECQTTLKSPNPIAPGKRVKCPKCGTGFTAPADTAEDEPAPAPAPKKKPAAPRQKSAITASKGKPPAAGRDDDDDPVYGVIKEPEEPEDEVDPDSPDAKPDLTFALDTSVKDPRGPAAARLVRPTNWLIGFGAFRVIASLVIVVWAIFPFIFSDTVLSDDQWNEAVLQTNYKSDKLIEKKPRASLSGPEWDRVTMLESVWIWIRVWVAVGFGLNMIVGGLICYGGVRAQMLESWGWGMASAIICLLDGNFLALLIGIWNIMTLNDKKVKAGFEYVPD